MKKRNKNKIILVLGLFLTFFCFNINAVNAETGDKGIIIERFEYDENDELILSWSVDYGYSEWRQQRMIDLYDYYEDLVDVIYSGQTTVSPAYFGIHDENVGEIFFIYDFIDCFEVTGSGKNQKISAEDFGTKICSMKFTAFGGHPQIHQNPVYPANGQYVKKSDIDAHYTTDFLESISLSFNRGSYIFNYQTSAYPGGPVTSSGAYPNYYIIPEAPFTMSSIFPIKSSPSPIDGVCGSANGSTFDWDDFDNQDFCSSGDFYLAGDNGERIIYHCAGLNGGTNQYNCFADYYYNLDPVITDVIDFDFDDFEYDFEEGDVSKNWLIDVFKFLFLPREQTLEKFFTAFDNFKQKIPFGYIYLIRDKFKEVSLESTDEFALNLELLGEDYEVFSVTSLKEQIGENTFNIFYNTMKALIWFIFVLYLITKSQKLFNNND